MGEGSLSALRKLRAKVAPDIISRGAFPPCSRRRAGRATRSHVVFQSDLITKHVGITPATLPGSFVLIHPLRQLMKARAAFNSALGIAFNVCLRAFNVCLQPTPDAHERNLQRRRLHNATKCWRARMFARICRHSPRLTLLLHNYIGNTDC